MQTFILKYVNQHKKISTSYNYLSKKSVMRVEWFNICMLSTSLGLFSGKDWILMFACIKYRALVSESK